MKKPTPFGKYTLLERINVGGMAEVFRAKAFGVEGFERLVAVKRGGSVTYVSLSSTRYDDQVARRIAERVGNR